MKKVLFTVAMVALCTVLATSASAASRGAEFTALGLPDGPFPLSQATDVSGDGEVIVGCAGFLGCGIFRYTDSDGFNGIEQSGTAPTISNNYDILGTPTSTNLAAIWTGGYFPNQTWGTPVATPPDYAACGGSGQGAFNISKDGNWITGLTWIDENGDGSGCEGASGFLNDYSTNTTTVLSNAVNNDSTRGNAVNGDGSVVVGWMQTQQREASKWVNGVQDYICPDPSGEGGLNFCNEGQDVTDDGNLMITKLTDLNTFESNAVIVDQAKNIEVLPIPSGAIPSFDDSFSAWAIAANGNTVVGSYGGSGFFGSPPYPVAWFRELGETVDLQVMLLGQGLDDLFFWFLSDALAVSDDGTVIVGRGTNPDGWVEAFKIDIGKVKVCHKPDGNGTGNDRTIAISWDSIGDHLAHGDALSTCEFAAADGRSRAIDRLRRHYNENAGAATDARLATAEQLKQLESRGGQAYQGGAALFQVESDSPDSVDSTGGQLSNEEREVRLQQLEDRIRRGPVHRGR